MRQDRWDPTDLLLKITSLEEGYMINFTVHEAERMAELDLKSLLFDHVRESDLQTFIAKLREFHGLRITQDPVELTYTAYRVENETKDV